MLLTVSQDLLVGTAVVLCLGAIIWCLVLVPRLRVTQDRFLVGLMGLMCTYHGLRVLRDAGILSTTSASADLLVGFAMSVIYLLAIAILEFYTADNRNLRYQLRLTEATQAPPLTPGAPVREDPGRAGSNPHAVLESAPVPLYVVDSNGAVLVWNAAAERLFGWSKQEMLGRRAPLLVDQAASQTESRLRRRDGQTMAGEVVTAPLGTGGLQATVNVVLRNPAGASRAV